jgi:hypothetical protein
MTARLKAIMSDQASLAAGAEMPVPDWKHTPPAKAGSLIRAMSS